MLLSILAVTSLHLGGVSLHHARVPLARTAPRAVALPVEDAAAKVLYDGQCMVRACLPPMIHVRWPRP